MPEQVFSISHLIPHFSEIWAGNLSSAHGLSAFIVLFLLIVGAFFLSFAIYKYLQAKQQIFFYEGLVRGLNRVSLLAAREKLHKKPSKIPSTVSFGKSLMKPLFPPLMVHGCSIP